LAARRYGEEADDLEELALADEEGLTALCSTEQDEDLPRWPLPVPTRTLPLLTIFLAAGAIVLTCAALTVHRRSAEELAAHATRTHVAIDHWLEHGYLRSGGIAVRGSGEERFFHRSSAGGRLMSGYLVQKVYAAVAGGNDWRVVALHNQVVSLLAAVLLGLLGFRVARRCGAVPLHSLVLGLSLQAVYFTFPDNLARYWEISGREWWLVFAALFLLIEERCVDGRTRSLTVAQGVATFFLTFMEYLAGIFFVTSYLVVTLLAGNDRAVLKRATGVCVLPCLLAVGVISGQLAVARAHFPEIPLQGSGFLFRTGLDGSTQYYVDHLDIATGRDLARRNFPHAGDQLFRWTWLFGAGAAALLAVLGAAMGGHVPRVAVVSLVSLAGTYILYAAIFSQSFVIHPYLYDVLLYTPLMFALVIVAPSLIESRTGHRGVAVIVILFLAVWVSLVQARRYMIWFPHDVAVARDVSNER
jgi:hypothetical protein